MTNPQTEHDQRRSRWHSYFEQTLLGKDYEIEAATDAAMGAVARGEGQAAIIAAGRAAGKRERSRRERSRPSTSHSQPQPPPAAPPHRPTWQTPETGRAASAPPPQPSGIPQSGPSAATRRPARIWPPNSAVVYMLEKRSSDAPVADGIQHQGGAAAQPTSAGTPDSAPAGTGEAGDSGSDGAVAGVGTAGFDTPGHGPAPPDSGSHDPDGTDTPRVDDGPDDAKDHGDAGTARSTADDIDGDDEYGEAHDPNVENLLDDASPSSTSDAPTLVNLSFAIPTDAPDAAQTSSPPADAGAPAGAPPQQADQQLPPAGPPQADGTPPGGTPAAAAAPPPSGPTAATDASPQPVSPPGTPAGPPRADVTPPGGTGAAGQAASSQTRDVEAPAPSSRFASENEGLVRLIEGLGGPCLEPTKFSTDELVRFVEDLQAERFSQAAAGSDGQREYRSVDKAQAEVDHDREVRAANDEYHANHPNYYDRVMKMGDGAIMGDAIDPSRMGLIGGPLATIYMLAGDDRETAHWKAPLVDATLSLATILSATPAGPGTGEAYAAENISTVQTNRAATAAEISATKAMDTATARADALANAAGYSGTHSGDGTVSVLTLVRPTYENGVIAGLEFKDLVGVSSGELAKDVTSHLKPQEELVFIDPVHAEHNLMIRATSPEFVDEGWQPLAGGASNHVCAETCQPRISQIGGEVSPNGKGFWFPPFFGPAGTAPGQSLGSASWRTPALGAHSGVVGRARGDRRDHGDGIRARPSKGGGDGIAVVCRTRQGLHVVWCSAAHRSCGDR
jgi:hypothetical protein